MIDVRLRFSKLFAARYMSHLDLMRCFQRAVRKSALPVWYTEGFNSHLYITFASPLALGFESICEAADIRLLADEPEQYMVERINSGLPFGIEVMSAGSAVMKPGEIAFSRYIIELGGEPADGLAAAVERMLLDPPSVQKTTKKGGVRDIDLKAGIAKSAVSTAGGLCFWDVTLASGSDDAINPKLALEALSKTLAREPEHQLIKRTQLLTRDMRLFE